MCRVARAEVCELKMSFVFQSLRSPMLRCLLAIASSIGACPSAAAAENPNVLFIVIDDQNDWVGPLGGHPLAKTPCLDQLAARGSVFLNAHCQGALCNSSRT